MKNKDYQGYSSFSYLSPHVDYRVFDMAEERGRVPVHNLGLSEDQEARAQQLLAENIVISLHDHPFRLPARPHELGEYQKEAHVAIGYEGLSRSGLDAVFDNIGGPAWSWEATIKDLGMRLCDIAHQNMVHIAYSIECIRKAHNTGKIAFVLGLEGAEVIGDDIDRIDILYGLGIRQMGIVYEKENSFGYGLHAVEDRGLTELGRRAVRRMNQLGMVIDLSHAGDRTSLDVIEESEFPVLISHAGAREVWNTRRMKSDEVIKACAANGGLIGIEAAPHTTISPRNPRHNIESVMDHFQYCIDLVGSSHVTFGPDTFFGDHVGLHNCLNEKLGLDAFFAAGPAFERIEYVSGLENPAECFPNIVRWLVFNGYSDDQIAEVIGGNTMRILDLIWKVAP